MWFLKFLFKKKFDVEFIHLFFQTLSERIPDLVLEWKKGGIIVPPQDASLAIIKKGKKVLFSQGSRSGWVDPFAAGEWRQDLMDAAKQFQLGQEKPNYLLGIICVVLYFIAVYGAGAMGMSFEDAHLNRIYSISVYSALITTCLMLLSYRLNWSHNLRSIISTLWILAIIAAAFSSVLLLPLVWAANRDQLARLY